MIASAVSYEVRLELESAGFSIFSGQGVPVLTPANQPESFQQARPRLELRCNIGSATGSRQYRAEDQTLQYNAWNFTMAIQAVNAPVADGVNALNQEIVALAKNTASAFAQTSWTDTVNFPNTIIAEPLKDAGESFVPKSADGYEYTILTFTGIVMIRPGVW